MRVIATEFIHDKTMATIVEVLKKWMISGFIPDLLVTNNGSEFQNEEFAKCEGYMG